ncbi:MAG: 16S rRNA (guanine(527)-N(7))-methyltransferase RsmG [Desulfobacteraceae bacterium]|nr:16S rRNA (guanine(527)-N(7))-methyltransferase RsmG [Desulfobacteraceae bacterium]
MEVGSQEWRALLVEGAAQVGIPLNASQAGQMGLHARALLEWNRKINLTAITDPQQVAIKHFLDAIVPLPYVPIQGPLLDIGTGGGFPGLPLKIMRPQQPMTLIDASRKKINFVKLVIRHLTLPLVDAHQCRVEEFRSRVENRERYQAIVTRAFANIETVARMASDLLAPEGRIIIYQGPGEETRRIQDGTVAGALKVLKTIDYQLPLIHDRRKLVVMGKG